MISRWFRNAAAAVSLVVVMGSTSIAPAVGANVDGSATRLGTVGRLVDRYAAERTGLRWIKGRYYQETQQCFSYPCHYSGAREGGLIYKNAKNGPMAFMQFSPDNVSYGETIELSDLLADGKRVGTKYKVRRHGRVRRHGLCYYEGGKRPGGQFYCNVPNIKERSVVVYRVGTCNGSRRAINCRNTRDWRWSRCKAKYRDDANTDEDLWDDNIDVKYRCRG